MRRCPRCNSRYEDATGFCPRDGSGLEDAPDDALLGQDVGHYRITALIGEGGMGAVYLAEHPGIGSRVAIKVLHPELARDRAAVARFFSEARSVNLIRHENIVNILDLSELPDGRSYIVMEYLEGESLASRLRQKGAFSATDAGKVMLPVLGALHAAHDHGIIHRDLKPDNIFVTRGGQVKVLDFGIAKLDIAHGGGSATRTGALLGTPLYMSPEQAAGRAGQVDHRSDIYSAGIILYELLTGQLPFVAEALYDLISKHLFQPPTPPRQLKPDIPEAVEAVVLRALAKEREARFGSAGEMANELEVALERARTAPLAAAPGAPVVVPPGASGPVGWAMGPPPGAMMTPPGAMMTPPRPAAIPPTVGQPAAPVIPPTVAHPAPPAYGMTPPPPGAPVPPTFPAALPRSTPGLGPAGVSYPAPGPMPPPGQTFQPPPAKSKPVWPVVLILVAGGLVWGIRHCAKLPRRPTISVTIPAVTAEDAGVAVGSPEDAGPRVVPVTLDGGAGSLKVAQGAQETKREVNELKREVKQETKREKHKEKEKQPEPAVAPAWPRPPEPTRAPPRAGLGMSGLYSGRINNLTANQKTTGRLLLNVSGTSVTGYLTVDPPLVGSGAVVGTLSGNQIQLRVNSGYGAITLRGVIIGKTITGSYTVGDQRGTYTMRR